MSNWPPRKVDGIDPCPFHGLVYEREAGRDLVLDPRDGRAPVALPATYGLGSSGSAPEFAPYVARQDGALWDIGRADPPVMPGIQAAGGKALGRRMVRLDAPRPVRLGDRTYQIEVSAEARDGEVSVYWARKGSPTQLISTWPVSAFGINWADCLFESTRGPASLATPLWGVRIQDATADGARALVGVSLGALGQAMANSLVGLIEVVLSLDVHGAIQAAATLVHTAGTLLGTATVSVASDVRGLGMQASGPGGCAISYPLIYEPYNTTGWAGTNTVVTERTGFAIGALYHGGGIELIRCDYRDELEITANMSKGDWQIYRPVTEDGVVYCEQWPDGAPPQPATMQTYARRQKFEVTLRFAGYSMSGHVEVNTTTSLSGRGGDGYAPITGTSTTIESATGGYGDEQTVSGEWPNFIQLGKPGVPDDTGKTWLPAPVWRDIGPRLSLVSRRNVASLGVFARYPSTPTTTEFWWLPVLTPTGVQGSAIKSPVRVTDPGGNGFAYWIAYSPITGEAVRGCDVPAARSFEGFI